MQLEAYIITHDTVQAIGLKYLLSQYFNINSHISTNINKLKIADYSNIIYFISPQYYIDNIDLFFPKRNRVVTLCQHNNNDHFSINTHCDVSEIVNQISTIIESLEFHIEKDSTELSNREIEVLQLIAKGHINKEIAHKLSISINTVLTHRKNITSKLGIKSVSGLSIYAIMNGHISDKDLMI